MLVPCYLNAEVVCFKFGLDKIDRSIRIFCKFQSFHQILPGIAVSIGNKDNLVAKPGILSHCIPKSCLFPGQLHESGRSIRRKGFIQVGTRFLRENPHTRGLVLNKHKRRIFFTGGLSNRCIGRGQSKDKEKSNKHSPFHNFRFCLPQEIETRDNHGNYK